MTDLEKAARMALEALGYYEVAGLATTRVAKSITALRQALEQPEYASDADTEELTHLNSLPEPLRLAAMLEKTMQWPLHGKAADCLRKMHAALSEQSAQQQEPVAWYGVNIAGVKYLGWKYEELDDRGFDVFPLYKSPQRKPLTDEAIWLEYQRFWPFHPADEPRLAQDIAKFARAIEAKLKEKNNGTR